MKRSSQVAAPLLASAALTLLGCHQPEMQRCVDANNKVVDDKLCANQPQTADQQRQLQEQQREHNGGSVIPSLLLYHYYYGGYGGRGIGSIVGGGSTAPLAGHSYSSSTSRGGFGSTHASSSEGGAHGEGGGHGGGE